MTALFVAAVVLSACAGAGITHALWWHCWQRWTDAHGYRRVDLEYRKVRQLWEDKDTAERKAVRWERRCIEAREHIGDLTLELAEARRPKHVRRVVPLYGAERQQVTA